MVPPLTLVERLRHSGDPLCHQAADALHHAQRQMLAAVIAQVRAEDALDEHLKVCNPLLAGALPSTN